MAFVFHIQSLNKNPSPVVRLEHELHGFSSYIVLPLFAFANAGVAIGEQGLAILGHQVPMGIAAGLFSVSRLALCSVASSS